MSGRRPRRKGGTLKDGERRQLARASRHAGAPPAPAPRDCALVLCDGGSRGNPGPSAIAAVLYAADGSEVDRAVEAIGRATAAAAEYRAIRLGLELAAVHGADPLEVFSDSRLAIAALDGRKPVDRDLAALVDDVRTAAGRLRTVRWCWHPRAENEAADALVRELLWS